MGRAKKSADGVLAGASQAEAEETERRFGTILEQVSDIVLTLDRDLRFVYVNRHFAETVGQAAEDLVGELLFERLPEVEGSPWHDAYERVLADGQPTVFEAHFAPLDSWFETRVFPHEGGLAVFATDITQRRRAEDEHREASDRRRDLIRSAPVALATIDLDGFVTSVSAAAERLLGWRAEELVAKGRVFLPDGLVEEALALYRRAASGETIVGFETKRLHKDGRLLDVSLSLAPLRNEQAVVTGVVAVLEDISERKRAERQAREYAERIETLREIDQALLASRGIDEMSLAALSRLRRLLGVSRTSVTLLTEDRTEFVVIAVDSEQETRVGAGARVPAGAFGDLEELRRGRVNIVDDLGEAPGTELLAKEGLRSGINIPLLAGGELLGTLNFSSDGAGPKALTVAREVADQLAVAIAFSRSIAKLEEQAHLLELAHVFVRDLDGRIVFWNRGAEQLYGYSRAEAQGQISAELLRTVFPEAAKAIEAKVLEQGAWHGHLVHRTKDGRDVVVASHWTLQRDADGRPVAILHTNNDITALRESEERLRLATEGAQMGVWEVRVTEGFAVADARTAEILGIARRSTPDELFERVHPDDRARVTALATAAFEGEAAYAAELRVLDEGGATKWVQATGTVLRDERGAPKRLLGVIADITERRLTEIQLGRTADRLSILRQIDNALLAAMGADDIAEAALSRTRELLGAGQASLALEDPQRAEMVIVAVSEIEVGVEIGTRLPIALLESFAGDALRGAGVVRVADLAVLDAAPSAMDAARTAGYRSALVAPVAVADAVVGLLFFFYGDLGPPCTDEDVDIAHEVAATLAMALEHQRSQSDLLQLAAELEERVAERTREAEEARAEAESANAAKSEFLSRMSHELRTPLNAVLGFAQLLQMEGLSDSQRDSAEQIAHAGGHLLELINEVLDIAGIEAGRLALSVEPVDAGAVVKEARDLVVPLAAGAGVELAEPDLGECWVLADRQRLLQVLLNLLSNAIKFNRPGGRVDLTCVSAGDGLRGLAVRDTGLGLDADELDRLFTPFQRLASAAGKEGAGLGLAVSRGLAQAMGGDLRCESKRDEGSTFVLVLRSAEAPGADPGPDA